MRDDRFANVAVVGTGMMGPGIALSFAQAGCRVALVGRSDESVRRGLAGLESALAFLAQHGIIADEARAELRERVWGTSDLEQAVAAAGLVQESIVEDLAQKQAIFRRLEIYTAPDALLASDTSGLRISVIVDGLARPQRAATAHFWNPPYLMPLVEITQGEHTSEETVQALAALLRECGKTPIVARKDVPGQIGNRLQHAMLREALYMLQEGIASAEDIDLALKLGPGRRWPVYGLLEHQDMVGLDLATAVHGAIVPELCRTPELLPVMQQLADQHRLGAKSGQGLYDWSQRDAQALQERRDAFLCMMARDW